uniref:MerR family transcriptional regulator n=1 Tax=Alicyclobacillus tolerans TaxID=90970 RepID=UPI0027E08FBC|nr:MerR family transcriptional regulator [Alicyclobacillus tolerans]
MDLNTRKQLPLFPIGIVQKLTGLTARQIRYYEQHGLVEPVRSEGKQRLFSFADVERLMEIRRLLDEGLNMAGVKAQLAKHGHGLTGTQKPEAEPTDEEVYKRLQQELMEGPSSRTASEFQGDLFRFYRRK